MTLLLIVKNEIKKINKNKGKFLLTLIIPILIVFFALSIQHITKPSISLGLIDTAHTPLAETFKQQATSIDGLKVADADPTTMQTDMIMAKFAAIITFDARGEYTVTSMNPELQAQIQALLTSSVKTGDLSSFNDLLSQMEASSLSTAERSVGFILLTLITTCSLVATNLLKDQQEGTLLRFSLAPTRLTAYILGQFLFNFLLTLLQIFCITLALWLFRVDLGIHLGAFFLLGVIIAFTAASFVTFLASFLKTDLQVSLSASSFALIISLLGGAFLPLAKMPAMLQFLSNLTFTKWLIALTGVFEQGQATSSDLIPVAMILLINGVFLVLASHLSKRKFQI